MFTSCTAHSRPTPCTDISTNPFYIPQSYLIVDCRLCLMLVLSTTSPSRLSPLPRQRPQLFNAVAVLLGIGILSLPLALAYAGWIAGVGMVIGFAGATCHTCVMSLSPALAVTVTVTLTHCQTLSPRTIAKYPSAKLLARLIWADGEFMGYTDIGKRAFGRFGSAGINFLYVTISFFSLDSYSVSHRTVLSNADQWAFGEDSVSSCLPWGKSSI